uniref:Superoxide dismutase [Cu-Zn] n=1 Tax=Philasterides dicentrarchi TaxID=282688 RepID=A0A410JA94_9CILI|nr:copper/zinc superoxide dismutase [Philasterides dicentrarchi]QKV26155.1 copper/zinc superoxide dismutase [Philasterides dicentrarchi]
MVEAKVTYAICILREDGGSGVNGLVKLRQEEGQQVELKAEIKGLSAGLHGFHIHQFGNLTEGCKTAGPHYNPEGVVHGGPETQVRHVGDLGNILSQGNGQDVHVMKDRLVNILDVLGRSFVVHAGEDDLGQGVGDKADESKKTGNAGARLACGVIGISGPFDW